MSDQVLDVPPLTFSIRPDGALVIHLVSKPGAPGLASEIQRSSDLQNWNSLPSAGAIFAGVVRQPDGTSLSTWSIPASANSRSFLRIRASTVP
mgnify:CR=1 FL=1